MISARAGYRAPFPAVGRRAQAGSTWNSAPLASASLTEIRYGPTVSDAPGATVTEAPSAEKVTPSAAIDSIAIIGPEPQESDVRPFLVTTRLPEPLLTIEPFDETLIWQLPRDLLGWRDGDCSAWAVVRSGADAGAAVPGTLEAHPVASSASAATPTSRRAGAVHDCERKIFTAGIVPVPAYRGESGSDGHTSKSSATRAASSRKASDVAGRSASSSIRPPVARWGSRGTTTTARQRASK
jgi:hypothetical protein